MTLRTGLLYGKVNQQDYDLSKLVLNLLQGSNVNYRGHVLNGLSVSYVLGTTTLTITAGSALVKCIRTGQTSNPILTHLQLSAAHTAVVSAPFKVWLEVKQTHIDDGLLHTTNGDNISEIKTGSSYPASNYLPLAEVDVGGVVTVMVETLGGIDDAIQNAVDDLLLGNSDFGDITADSLELPGGDVQDQIDAINNSISSESELNNNDYISGEAITVGDSLFIETGPVFVEAKNVLSVGDVAANSRQSIKAIGSGVASDAIKLALKKFVSPSVNLNFRIELDDDGKPSGQLFAPNAIAAILPGALSTSLADTTIVLSGAAATDGHGVTLNVNETNQLVHKGVKFTLTSQVGLLSVLKVAACTATKAYLHNAAGTLLATATFSGNVATFNYTNLVNGQSYYVLVGKDFTAYTSVKQTGAGTFPYIASKLNFVQWDWTSQTVTDTAVNTGYGGTGAVPVDITFIAKHTCRLLSAFSTGGGVILYAANGTTVIETSDAGGGFSGNTILQAGTTYKIHMNGYNNYANGSGAVTTFSLTNIEITDANAGGPGFYISSYSISTGSYTETNTDINNIVSLSLSENILIPKGQPVHIVAFQGSYGSETINATNYYGIGYATKNTNTRPALRYNGSSYLLSESTTVVTDTDNLTLNTNQTGSAAARGYKVQALATIRVQSVTKDSSFCNATRAIVKDNAGVVLATATFSGNTATFSVNIKIARGSYFRIELDSNGSNYQQKTLPSASFPQARTNISYISGSSDGMDDTTAYNIDSIDTVVCDCFAYCSSLLFTDQLLAKTSAYYQYKMPNIPRISRLAYAIGELVQYDFKGVTKKVVAPNTGYPLYIANADGLLSILPGNIKFHMGDILSPNNVLLSKGKSYVLGTTDIIYADDVVVSSSLINTLTKVKEFVVKDTMTMNIYFEHRFVTDGGGAGSATVVSRIYKNGVALGTQRTDTSTSFVAYTESLSLTAGDLIQLYTSSGRTVNPSVVEVQNFRVLGTIQREYRSDFTKSF